MSDFSAKCKEYVAKSNTNIYQLAKQSGLERTTLQRMVNGNRLPAVQVVRQFCSHLQITPMEEEELLELYKIEKIGRDVYQTRKEIRNLLLDIQRFRVNWGKTTEFRNKNMPFELMSNVNGVYRLPLELDIMAAIQYVIEKEISQDGTAVFDMDMIPQCEYVLQQLMRVDQTAKKKIICCQYVSFVRKSFGGSSMTENIRILRRIVPFALSFCNTYQVRYSYRTCTESESAFQLWPHFLVTSKSLILFSNTLSNAILIENLEIVNCYRDELRTMAKQSRVLFDYYSKDGDLEEAFHYYKNTVNAVPQISFGGQPFVSRFFYPELLKSEDMVGSSPRQVSTEGERPPAESLSEERLNYFGLTGLEEFLDTGKLPGVYGKYARRYSVFERKRMLEHYIGSLYTDARKSYLLKEESLQLCSGIMIEFYESGELYFLSVSEHAPFVVIGMREWGIYEAFRDYFVSLKESDDVYGEEETKEILAGKKDFFLIEKESKELEAASSEKTG